MTYRPFKFAQLADSRFNGIERSDLRAAFGAILDGTSHPLSAMGLAAAQALFPNIGLSASTDLTKYEQDTAAWLQAEYTLRTGPGGVIGLPDGSTMMVSSQLWLQNASKVWFHGGRGVVLMTAGCGSTPAIRVSHASGGNAVPLRDLVMLARPSLVYVSGSTGGVAHTGYQPGSQALSIDNCQGAVFERVCWNGFDTPIAWGNNTYCVTFREWVGSGCNIGLNWNQTGSLNSMERMRFENGAAANCNYGVLWDATYANAYSQGGSVFLTNNSLDYNIVRQIVYKGMAPGASSCGNSFHVTGNHIETTGQCSGTSLCRVSSAGALFVSHNEFYEGDNNVPPGLIEVADATLAAAQCNRINNNSVPVFYSSTSNPKRISGGGNLCQDSHVRPILLSDGSGKLLQREPNDGQTLVLFNNPNPIDLNFAYTNIVCDYVGQLTLPSDQQANFVIGSSFQVTLFGPGPVTLVAPSGVTFNAYPGARLTVDGATCNLTKVGSNNWVARGSLSA